MASSILGMPNMGSPFLVQLKKQASFFLKEKIKTARLALTDVTPAQLLTEEVTNGSSWAPDAKTMGFISRAAFEIDDYWRIVEILHKRKQWREPYHAIIVLEHLLTHGPESVADEFQADGGAIEQLGNFQYIDERGFNWGLTVRKKSERVLKLLEKGPLLKEERDRARKVTRGIQGFGSFNHRWSSNPSSCEDHYAKRCNSHYEDFIVQEDFSDSLKTVVESKPLLVNHEDKPKVELQKEEEHPFSSVEHKKKMESLLLLN
ncbi:ENTH domain-containing protein C794.11c isoform X2 [Dioscorea cayenensis subsp. rotundata]|uniref:ENTH domain-containing protein C794.11c isoform X2 n=1 Tax=Dioscorea cayennensis subsp. rotundata TaxID=55577 RepID=A0AB40D1X9_DIOCR|nr:ENTH domain-containing protein C794.11c isoform X2 [Dioscorea cayenensis subsp. rotundata]